MKPAAYESMLSKKCASFYEDSIPIYIMCSRLQVIPGACSGAFGRFKAAFTSLALEKA